jgi:hypothetical protein
MRSKAIKVRWCCRDVLRGRRGCSEPPKLCALRSVRPPPPVQRADYERAVAATRTQLDADTFAAEWAQGRAITLEQAMAYALDVDQGGNVVACRRGENLESRTGSRPGGCSLQ